MHRYGGLLALVCLALSGPAILLYVTRGGIGASPDSIAYIGAARSFVAGDGLTLAYGERPGMPITFHAPLYSLLIAALARVNGIEPATAVRWLNAFIFGANILLAALLVYSVAPQKLWPQKLWPQKLWPALAGGLLILTSLTMLNIHAYAWTEPLFIWLCFSGFWLLAMYWRHGRYPLLFLAAACIGLAVLTRYAGLSLIAVGGLGIVLFAGRPWRRRLQDGIVFGMIALLPFVLWMLRNQMLAEGATGGREVAFHPMGAAQLWQAVFTLTNWLHVPDGAPGILRVLVIFAFVAGLGGLLWWVYRGAAAPGLLKLLLLFVLIYPAFLALSISFFDANTPLDDRILSPLYMAGVVLALAALARLPQKVAQRQFTAPWLTAPWLTVVLMAILMTIAVLFVGTAVSQEARWVKTYAHQGLGFSSLAWQQSPTIARVRQLPDVPIYSNVPEAIYLHTGKSARAFPRQFNAVSQTISPHYDADMAYVRAQIAGHSGVIVYFHTLRPEARQTVAEIEAQQPLHILFETGDGTIYTADNANSK